MRQIAQMWQRWMGKDAGPKGVILEAIAGEIKYHQDLVRIFIRNNPDKIEQMHGLSSAKMVALVVAMQNSNLARYACFSFEEILAVEELEKIKALGMENSCALMGNFQGGYCTFDELKELSCATIRLLGESDASTSFFRRAGGQKQYPAFHEIQGFSEDLLFGVFSREAFKAFEAGKLDFSLLKGFSENDLKKVFSEKNRRLIGEYDPAANGGKTTFDWMCERLGLNLGRLTKRASVDLPHTASVAMPASATGVQMQGGVPVFDGRAAEGDIAQAVGR